jgi:uncharacterized membrane protein YgcG
MSGRLTLDRLRRILATACLAALAITLTAAPSPASAAGPPFPDRRPGFVFDEARAFARESRRAASQSLRDLRRRTNVDVVVYTQVKGRSRTAEDVRADARALFQEWQIGGPRGNGVVIFWDFDRDLDGAIVEIVGGDGYMARHLDGPALRDIVATELRDDLAATRWQAALTRAVVAISIGTSSIPESSATTAASPAPTGTLGASAPGASTPGQGVRDPGGPAPTAGPPYPEPVEDQVVYDFAGILSPATEATASRTIAAIEERTAAEIVVYTQVKPESDSVEEAEQDAIALIDQWGVGRRGFDDGLAILFDMDESLCHGQVQLYAGPGYRAAFLDNAERQAIFDDDMLPLLRACDIDAALLAGLARIDAIATPEHAATLQAARQIDAVLGLVGAPVVFLGMVMWAAITWLRVGKDPVYLDDPSILMPAPPPDLTAASGALIYDGRPTRHVLSTAMLDLASRGELAFREESGVLGLGGKKVGVQLTQPVLDDPDIIRTRRRPISEAEGYALERLRTIGGTGDDGYIEPEELLKFGQHVDTFDDRLEKHVVAKGWFREAPSKSMERWSFRGGVEVVLGFLGILAALELPSQGLMLISGAVLVAGILTLILARAMPARSMAGAVIYAMLAAYRRTLRRTMEQARSMRQVVDSRAVPWLETPDQALVWGVALGLQEDVERVIERSLEDAREGRAAPGQAWVPAWYGGSDGSFAGAGASGGGSTAGLFSSSAVPDFGGMMSAIGTIGNSPSSSGSGSGGFSGGGSGGGGGGSGGGF